MCTPARVKDVHKIMKEELWAYARIRVHQGAARVRVLGAPIGSPEYVIRQLEAKSTEHAVLLDRIPAVTDVQAAWLLLLFCGATCEQLAQQFAEAHDENVWQCLRRVISTTDEADRTKWGATLPFSLGGLGLGSAVRTREAAHWVSWADSFEMICNRHPTVAALSRVLRRCGFVNGSWTRDSSHFPLGKHWRMANDLPVKMRTNQVNPNMVGNEKQRDVQRHILGKLRLAEFDRFPQGIVEVTTRPVGISCLHSLLHQQGVSYRSRLLLCRRLRLPMPLSSRTCRCGRLLDVLGHHWAACAEAGVLGRRGFALECAAAQVCREAGGRVSTNVMVRDLDVAEFNLRDTRRLEVVADGLSIFGGAAQFAIDTTL